MTLCDVNILVYAHRADAERHAAARKFLTATAQSGSLWAYSSLVLSGFVRVVTHSKVFKTPTPLPTALAFTEYLRNLENTVEVMPGKDHWGIFTALLRVAETRGNLVPDCYIAALAIEHNCTFVTADRNFTRYRDLKLSFLK